MSGCNCTGACYRNGGCGCASNVRPFSREAIDALPYWYGNVLEKILLEDQPDTFVPLQHVPETP